MGLFRGPGVLLLALAAPGLGQTIAASSAPQSVSVTIYRDPGRDAAASMELDWLEGYALISETRTIMIPPGDAEIRFEGVAGGIIPQSAIVSGLPEGVAEKNQDAYLLSPASLLDRSLGRRVHLRRTSLTTGAVREEEAVVRSGADGAVVLQTAAGFEALRCTGLKEDLVYGGVPEGLSAKPTLSVRTRGARGGTATVTLSYLATGFDWQANYIAHLNPAGDRVDLFAWVTLANGDETGFAEAQTQAVAGRPNREADPGRSGEREAGLRLECWPQARTSDIPLDQPVPPPAPPPPPAMPAPVMYDMVGAESIVVTGSRMKAEQEELGDLKLYRIPEPVTVAAKSQKQVAMLEQPGVTVRQVYRGSISGADGSVRTTRILVTRNRKAEGLGLPLPAGGVVLFAEAAGRPVLVGEGAIRDSSVGEDVEIELGAAIGVHAQVTKLGDEASGSERFELTVSNDSPRNILYEAEFPEGVAVEGRRLDRRDGRPLWAVTVPANGSATLRYRIGPELQPLTGRGR